MSEEELADETPCDLSFGDDARDTHDRKDSTDGSGQELAYAKELGLTPQAG